MSDTVVGLDIRLLGHANVLAGGVPIKFAKRATTMAMLALVVLRRGQPVARNFLAFTLFPDVDEETAHAELRRYLYLAGKALPAGDEWLIVDADAVRWNSAAKATVDVLEFERLAGDAATQTQALDLYAGDLLEDVYDDWVVIERERLRSIFLKILGDLILRHRSAREHSAALGYAQRLLAADPWREDVVRQVMAIRYASGDTAGALAEFEHFAKRLHEEMGTATVPMPETMAMREAIVRGDPLIGSVERVEDLRESRERRPARALPFVGRAQERERLRAQWDRAARGFGNMVVVSGEAGVGKSRLVAELALVVEAEGGRVYSGGTTSPESLPYQCVVEAVRAAFPVLIARPMDSLAAGVLATVLPELREQGRELAEVPKLAPDREAARLFDALAAAVASLASARPLLLVLEDLHWAGNATLAAVASIARRLERSRVLVVATYREEETPAVHPLRQLIGSLGAERRISEMHLQRLGREDVSQIVSLLDDLAPSGDATVERLYAISEGNPLFLNEAIASARESSGAGAPEASVPGGIGPVVAARTARLSEDARTVAEIAAVCGGGSSVDVIRDVAGFSAAQTLAAFDELLDRRLVREAGARERFDFVFTHHLIGASIYEQIGSAVRARRHARIARVIEQRQGTGVDMARELGRHYDLAGSPDEAARWYVRGAHEAIALYANDDAIRFATLALEKSDASELEIEALFVREEAAARLGRRDVQARDLDRLSGLARNPQLRCRVLRRRALFLRLSDDREAERRVIAALHDAAAAAGDPRWQALAAVAEARVAVATGDYEKAKRSATAALSLLKSGRDDGERIESFSILIEAHVALGELDAAARLLKQTQTIAQEAGDLPLVVETIMESTSMAMLQQRFDQALALSQEAQTQYLAIGDRVGEARALANAATAAVRLSRWEQARAANLAAAQTFETIGDRSGLARVQMNLAMLHARCGDLSHARRFIASARAHHERLGDERARTASLLNESFIALWQRRPDEAKSLALEALANAQKMGHAAYRAQALANLGAAERDLSELDSAVAHMDEGLALQLELGRLPDAVSDLADAALARAMRGDLGVAVELAERILSIDPTWTDAAIFPPYPPWIVACVFHWADDARAASILSTASELATSFTASIDSAELRRHFEALPFFSAIKKAETHDQWPPRPWADDGSPRTRKARRPTTLRK